MKQHNLKQLIKEEIESNNSITPNVAFAIHKYLLTKVSGFEDEYPLASNFYFDIKDNI